LASEVGEIVQGGFCRGTSRLRQSQMGSANNSHYNEETPPKKSPKHNSNIGFSEANLDMNHSAARAFVKGTWP